MIQLDVEKYCQNCPGFEAHVDISHLGNGMGNDTYTTTIMCKSRNGCAAMMRYLKKEHDKEVINDAN